MTDRRQLGDGPIVAKHAALMNKLGVLLDRAFNGNEQGEDRKNGFILIVFPFSEATEDEPRANYVSNASRDDVVIMLKEQVARFEGQSMEPGRG